VEAYSFGRLANDDLHPRVTAVTEIDYALVIGNIDTERH
jgi:hypothetical protein